MREVWFLVGLMALGTAARAAEDIEPADVEFLEYLGTLEDDDSNWTLLEDAESNSKTTATTSQAETARAKKPEPSKEAASPAAEKR